MVHTGYTTGYYTADPGYAAHIDTGTIASASVYYPRFSGLGGGLSIENVGTPAATATLKIKYATVAYDGNMPDVSGYFIGNPHTTTDTYEYTCGGIIERTMVYRGRYNPNTANHWTSFPVQSAAERLKSIIADRCAPSFIRNRRALNFVTDIREIRARQTLRRVIGDDKFRNFIRNGFISVRAKSGKTYQIFPGHDITRVYFCGKMVERLCVVLSGNFPATDSLIMRYLLILNNEEMFRSYANVSAPLPLKTSLPKKSDSRSLVEIFASFKKAA